MCCFERFKEPSDKFTMRENKATTEAEYLKLNIYRSSSADEVCPVEFWVLKTDRFDRKSYSLDLMVGGVFLMHDKYEVAFNKSGFQLVNIKHNLLDSGV